MGGFLGTQETLTRERVKEIFRDRQYSYFEQKVTLLEVRDDSLLLRISFLLEYKNRMIAIEEKEPIVVQLADFKIGFRQIYSVENRYLHMAIECNPSTFFTRNCTSPYASIRCETRNFHLQRIHARELATDWSSKYGKSRSNLA
jgi:hypothetical protein